MLQYVIFTCRSASLARHGAHVLVKASNDGLHRLRLAGVLEAVHHTHPQARGGVVKDVENA